MNKNILQEKMQTISDGINKIQIDMDSVTMDIGKEYALYRMTNDENLMESININVELRKQLELRIKDLKKEFNDLNKQLHQLGQ